MTEIYTNDSETEKKYMKSVYNKIPLSKWIQLKHF